MSSVNEKESGVEMDLQIPSPADERPPPPPKEWYAAALPAFVEAPAPVPTPALAEPRLGKKISWKGKNILVLIPRDDERGQKGKAPTPMTDREIEAMLKEWEQLGYDTTGFNLGPNAPDTEEGSQGQSRSVWPHDQDILNERGQSTFRVSIPDRKGKFWCSSFVVFQTSFVRPKVWTNLHSSLRVTNLIP
jgi:hypothetical protein